METTRDLSFSRRNVHHRSQTQLTFIEVSKRSVPCEGFLGLSECVSKCIVTGDVPVTSRIRSVLVIEAWKGDLKQPVLNFITKIGTVGSVVQALFSLVLGQDKFRSEEDCEGEYDELWAEDVEKIPKCRNDREIIFALRQYAKVEKYALATTGPLPVKRQGAAKRVAALDEAYLKREGSFPGNQIAMLLSSALRYAETIK
ncbi:MAG: hypothetical protein MMC33_003095 [Icmadophila ericetorum]|nr:hypothetical protein [Icmadophila ericetorum]